MTSRIDPPTRIAGCVATAICQVRRTANALGPGVVAWGEKTPHFLLIHDGRALRVLPLDSRTLPRDAERLVPEASAALRKLAEPQA